MSDTNKEIKPNRAVALQEVKYKMVNKYPEEIQAAMFRAAAARSMEGQEVPDHREQRAPAESSPLSGKPAKAERLGASAGPTVPASQYLTRYAVLDRVEQREWEKEAAAYMDGYENGAEWVMEDQRTGTVL